MRGRELTQFIGVWWMLFIGWGWDGDRDIPVPIAALLETFTASYVQESVKYHGVDVASARIMHRAVDEREGQALCVGQKHGAEVTEDVDGECLHSFRFDTKERF